MSALLLVIPVGVTAVLAWMFWRLNRRRRWFTTGEMIFWTVVLLIVMQLLSLLWL